MSALEYVNDIALEAFVSRKKTSHHNQQMLNWGEDAAIINAGAINVFDNQLSVQNKQDIGNSILFAQLAANKQYDRYTDSNEWFTFFISVLNNIGWSTISITHNRSVGEDINWENFVLGAMKSAAAENELELAQRAMSSWQNLSLESKAMTIWNDNTVESQYQNFQVIPADFQQQTGLNIVLASIASQAEKELNGFLSFTNHYTVQEHVTRMVLNESVYAEVREVIIEKLGDRVNEYMANLPLNT